MLYVSYGTFTNKHDTKKKKKKKKKKNGITHPDDWIIVFVSSYVFH